MSDREFQDTVLKKLGDIEAQLRAGEKRFEKHEARISGLEISRAEMKGRVAVIASAIAMAFSIFCIWVGKHL